MRIPIVQIGNSKGIRIPRAILRQCSIVDEVDLEVTEDKLVLTPLRRRRSERVGFDDVADMTDKEVQSILRDMYPAEVAVALVGAPEGVRDKVLKNMSEGAAKAMRGKIAAYQRMSAKQLLIEMNRSRVAALWHAQQ